MLPVISKWKFFLGSSRCNPITPPTCNPLTKWAIIILNWRKPPSQKPQGNFNPSINGNPGKYLISQHPPSLTVPSDVGIWKVNTVEFSTAPVWFKRWKVPRPTGVTGVTGFFFVMKFCWFFHGLRVILLTRFCQGFKGDRIRTFWLPTKKSNQFKVDVSGVKIENHSCPRYGKPIHKVVFLFVQASYTNSFLVHISLLLFYCLTRRSLIRQPD